MDCSTFQQLMAYLCHHNNYTLEEHHIIKESFINSLGHELTKHSIE